MAAERHGMRPVEAIERGTRWPLGRRDVDDGERSVVIARIGSRVCRVLGGQRQTEGGSRQAASNI